MRELMLSYHDTGRPTIQSYGVEWPSTQPLLWASLNPNPGLKVMNALGNSFIMACLPPDHKVYFAVATEDDPKKLKSILTSRGERFQEASETIGKKTVGHGLFPILTLGRRVPVRLNTLFASTMDRDVISAVLEHNGSPQNLFILPFFVASTEPRDWMLEVAKFFKPGVKRNIDRSLIDSSRCIILKMWDHGFDFISSRVTRAEFETITRETVSENNL
ncbi:hypothetical protein J2P12_06005, partial [Candidatus Bathyarchaeota archaeon]|nr:hypothetical protein [Candidatus Bathyarchaeota archaeon]